jgi:plasmid replication initiation protein
MASNTLVNFKKATGSVEISEPDGALTLADRRLWNHLLAHAYPRLTKDEVFSIRLSDVRAFAAEARGGAEEADNRRLKESIERLQKTVVRFNFLDTAIGEIWQSAQLLGTCEIITRSGELQYSYPRGLPEKLIEPALYSYLSLKVIYQFQSKYALILYETLKRFADRDAAEPYWPVKTSQLRDLLGCRDKLANWQLFRRRALDPAVAEINELSGFVVELMEIRQGSGRGGGKVVSAVFHIRRKSSEEARTAVREIEKPRLQRRGERKIKQADDLAARAIRWLEGSDISTRRKWCERAQELGVQVPGAGTAKENLHKWVPSIAPLLAEEENVR